MAVVTPRLGSRLCTARVHEANTCAALRYPPHGEAMTWRSYVGSSARPVHMPGPAKQDSAGWVQTYSESPGVEGDDVLDGPRSSPCPRGIGESRRVPSWSGAPRKPSPSLGRSCVRGILVENSNSGFATL